MKSINRRQAVKTLFATAAATAIATRDEAVALAAPTSGVPVRPVAPGVVQPFPLTAVRLLDGPFKAAQSRDLDYLISLEPDRFLHNFRKNAGLTPKAPIYGGWESEGVAGHVLGHYLSALSLMHQSTNDARLKSRVDYIVEELALCQARDSTGYVSAIPDGKAIFAAVAAGDGGAITRGWVPWYTQHKVMAGLRDAYQLTGNEKAKTVLVGMADWTDATTKNLSDAENQKMLDTEHGGMNEVLADVYALTGDPKYLTTAGRFYHRRVLVPLTEQRDALDGFHSNTQIPKVIGLARIHELTGDAKDATAARFFWDTVVNTRSYAIGGNGDYEHFFPTRDFGKHLDSSATAETCCTYNMLKLTRQLFVQDPSVHYADYYERALYNHILASQEPEKGMMIYFSPMRPGHFKVYSSPTESFWCCVGTGIENHAKYGDSIYFHDDKSLTVNLFIPSELTWTEKGLTVRQETSFPAKDTTRLTLTGDKGEKIAGPLTVKLRYPSWAEGMTVAINGKAASLGGATPGSYVALTHPWKSGDTIDVHLPMGLRAEPLPNSPKHTAILYGPIVLAGDLGTEGLDKIGDFTHAHEQNKYAYLPGVPTPVWIVPDGKADLTAHIQPVAGKELTFQTHGLGQPNDVTLLPFYQLHHRRYNLYWHTYTAEGWKAQQVQVAAEEAERRALELRTVDAFRPGEQQSEVDHAFRGERSATGPLQDKKWRDAKDGGFFELTLKVSPTDPMELSVTYWGSDGGGNRNFDILVDGFTIATESLNADKPGQFWDKAYPISPGLTKGKSQVVVRFQGKPGNHAGGIFGCRTLKAMAK